MKRKLEKKFPAWPAFAVLTALVAFLAMSPEPVTQPATSIPKKELRVYTPVPEPQTYALLAGLGLLLFVAIRRQNFRE